jgi:hypothetical protein
MDEIKFGLMEQRPSVPEKGMQHTPEEEAEKAQLAAEFWALVPAGSLRREVSFEQVDALLGRHENGGQ